MDAVGIRPRIHPVGSARRPSGTALGMALCAFAATGCASSHGSPDPHADGAVETEPRPDARVSSAGEFARVERAIRRYAADRAGRLPVKLEDLTKEVSPEGDRYLMRVPTDAWGRPYAYAVVSARLGAYDLRSFGPDNLPGTADDVVADAEPVPVH